MKILVFDIETADVFGGEKKNPEDLEMSICGVYVYSTNEYKTFEVGEMNKLEEILKDIDTLVGFNSNHFDIPILNKYTDIDLKEYRSIDLLEEVKNSIGRRIKLDSIAEGTLGVKKSGVGVDAVKWWKNGEKDKVAKYCLDDVKITKDLFDYVRKHKTLKYSDFGAVIDVRIDVDSWRNTETEKDLNATIF